MIRILMSIMTTWLFLVYPYTLHAQWAVSPHVVISIPKNNFANINKTGGGFGIKFERALSFGGKGLVLRGDFAFLSFGRTIRQVNTNFGPLLVESKNEGLRLTVGPQFQVGGRSFKAYIAVSGGVYFFRINETAQSSFGSSTAFFRTPESNWALGWNFGGGIQYDIGLGPWLDVSFEYQTMYDLPAPVENAQADTRIPDATAHEYTIKFGVIFFLGR